MIFQDLITSCDIGLSTVILRSSLLKKNKLLFPRIKTKEDFVLWLKIIKKIKIIKGIDIKLSNYRKTKGSLSSNILLSLISGYKVYKDYMNYGITKSLFYLLMLSLKTSRKKSVNYFLNFFNKENLIKK